MLVLASASPRRAMLLQDWGYRFEIVKASVPEWVPPEVAPRQGVLILAVRKAEAGLTEWLWAGGGPDDVIIGADTMVVLEDDVLGKPDGREEAVAMLKRLSGCEHTVMTGVALHRGWGVRQTGVVETRVRFRSLSDEEIYAYVAGGEPLDKAGAYGIQGEARQFVEYYDGSYTNVVGLPMEFVRERLTAWGIEQANVAPREVQDGLPSIKRFTGGIVAP